MSQSLRIAVADDELDMRDYYARILPRLGHQVVAVSATGADLVKQCRTQHPDLVITDVRMPDMDGIEAANQLCQHEEVPVILVTACPEQLARAQEDHVKGFLVKPIRTADLQSILDQILE